MLSHFTLFLAIKNLALPIFFPLKQPLRDYVKPETIISAKKAGVTISVGKQNHRKKFPSKIHPNTKFFSGNPTRFPQWPCGNVTFVPSTTENVDMNWWVITGYAKPSLPVYFLFPFHFLKPFFPPWGFFFCSFLSFDLRIINSVYDDIRALLTWIYFYSYVVFLQAGKSRQVEIRKGEKGWTLEGFYLRLGNIKDMEDGFDLFFALPCWVDGRKIISIKDLNMCQLGNSLAVFETWNLGVSDIAIIKKISLQFFVLQHAMTNENIFYT